MKKLLKNCKTLVSGLEGHTSESSTLVQGKSIPTHIIMNLNAKDVKLTENKQEHLHRSGVRRALECSGVTREARKQWNNAFKTPLK